MPTYVYEFGEVAKVFTMFEKLFIQPRRAFRRACLWERRVVEC